MSFVWFAAWLLLVTRPVATSPHQAPPTEPSTFRRAQEALEDGRFADAENLAQRAVELASDSARQAEAPGERERAADLLVEALIANGRGAEAATRSLAEDLVRRRESGANAALLANAARRLGDVLAHPVSTACHCPVRPRDTPARDRARGRRFGFSRGSRAPCVSRSTNRPVRRSASKRESGVRLEANGIAPRRLFDCPRVRNPRLDLAAQRRLPAGAR